MVLTITAPLWADISDRAARLLGRVSYGPEDEVVNEPRPWWARRPIGRISYIDDFEYTLNWAMTDGAVTKANDIGYVHDGNFAMKLVTGVVAANAAGAEIYIAPLAEDSVLATLGMWIDLSAAADTTPRDFSITWIVEDKTFANSETFGLRFSNYQATVQQRKLQFWNDTPAWEDVPAGTARVRITKPEYHYFEIMVVRHLTGRWMYWSVRMDDQVFSLAGEYGDAGALAAADQNIILACTTDAAFATTMYVDDLTVTDLIDSTPL